MRNTFSEVGAGILHAGHLTFHIVFENMDVLMRLEQMLGLKITLTFDDVAKQCVRVGVLVPIEFMIDT